MQSKRSLYPRWSLAILLSAVLGVLGTNLPANAACTNPTPLPPGYASPCPVWSVSPASISQSGTETLTATPQPGTDYIYTTAYISQGTTWNPYILAGNNAAPNYSSALASLTLSSAQLSALSIGTHYTVVWDWLWDATAQCYKGPGLNQCNTGQWRVQSFTITITYAYSQSSYYAYSQAAYYAYSQSAYGSLPNGYYTTNFPLTENPISEGGVWTGGSAAGGNLWGDVQTNGTMAFGVSEPTQFGDPTAILKGTWAVDQTAQATVALKTAFTGTCCHEVELRLRMTVSSNSIRGYEAYCSVSSSNPYCHIARWNGLN